MMPLRFESMRFESFRIILVVYEDFGVVKSYSIACIEDDFVL
jgi:hypothetical protein